MTVLREREEEVNVCVVTQARTKIHLSYWIRSVSERERKCVCVCVFVCVCVCG